MIPHGDEEQHKPERKFRNISCNMTFRVVRWQLIKERLWEAHGNLCTAECPRCHIEFSSPPPSKRCDRCSTGETVRATRNSGHLRRKVHRHTLKWPVVVLDCGIVLAIEF